MRNAVDATPPPQGWKTRAPFPCATQWTRRPRRVSSPAPTRPRPGAVRLRRHESRKARRDGGQPAETPVPSDSGHNGFLGDRPQNPKTLMALSPSTGWKTRAPFPCATQWTRRPRRVSSPAPTRPRPGAVRLRRHESRKARRDGGQPAETSVPSDSGHNGFLGDRPQNHQKPMAHGPWCSILWCGIMVRAQATGASAEPRVPRAGRFPVARHGAERNAAGTPRPRR
jgi:hypothetical protein